jgi:hypothetical protein
VQRKCWYKHDADAGEQVEKIMGAAFAAGVKTSGRRLRPAAHALYRNLLQAEILSQTSIFQ